MIATDKRTWNIIGSFFIGLLVLMLTPFLVMVTIATKEADMNHLLVQSAFQGMVLDGVSEEFIVPLEKIIEEFEELQEQIDYVNEIIGGEDEEVEEEVEEEKGLDEIKIKSFFYVLYFKEETEIEDELYLEFVEAFTEKNANGEEVVYEILEEEEEIYSNVESAIEREISTEERMEIEQIYGFMKYGYISGGGYVDEFSSESFKKLMAEATKYIGFPYVWGGSTPATSFDCSGFICWSYTQSGVYKLPRTTAQGVYNQCVPIQKKDIQQGDFVFFTGTYETNKAVTHIGIYVGENQMLHCGDPIGYADLNNSYWKKHFYAYGRLKEQKQ